MSAESATKRYRWPWFVLGAVALAIVLVTIAMITEARRVYRMKQQRIESGYYSTLTNPPAK